MPDVESYLQKISNNHKSQKYLQIPNNKYDGNSPSSTKSSTCNTNNYTSNSNATTAVPSPNPPL